MNTDRTTETIVEAWLAEGFTATPDVETMLDGLRAGVAATPQRRHRWWIFGRTAAVPVPESGSPPARGFTMFSAVKFMVASVIVALFSGFLMMGVLTTQHSDEVPPAAVSASPAVETTSAPTEAPTISVRTDILPGIELTVEEVEPGVFRVLNDGVRTRFGSQTDFSDIIAGHDGSILLVEQGEETPRRHGSFARLGSDESCTFPTYGHTVPAVSPDGTVWVSGVRNDVHLVHSLTDGKWTTQLRAPSSGGWHGLTVAPGGTIWAWDIAPTKSKEDRFVIRRLGTDGWQRLAKPTLGGDPPLAAGDPVVTESGELWRVPQRVGHSFLFDDDGSWQMVEGDALWRLHTRERRGGGSEWEQFAVDALVFDQLNTGVELGSDGMVWVVGVNPVVVDGQPVRLEDSIIAEPAGSFVMRYDGSAWQRWGPDDGVPSLTWSGPQLEQAPDGGLWIVAQPGSWFMPEGTDEPAFDGIARFDGSTWQYFLSGHDVGGWDVAPDGSVWLRADGGLYVITPEAVAVSR